MRKLLSYCRRAPQLVIVLVLFPFIAVFYSRNLTFILDFCKVISKTFTFLLSLINFDFNVQISLTIGQSIITCLVLYTCVKSLLSMIDDLAHGTLGIDLLAFVALLATLCIGEFWASYLIVVMVFTGEAIEDFAQDAAQKNLSLLVNASPQTAHLMTLPGIVCGESCEQCALLDHSHFRKVSDESSLEALQEHKDFTSCESCKKCHNNSKECPILQEVKSSSQLQRYKTVPVEDLKIGNVIVVLPGETVPVDGELLSGSAVLDTSAINGESLPREVFAGAQVLSGCVNGGVVLIMRVTKLSQNSQYQKIMKLVESARSSKAAVVRFADMLSVPFTVLSFVIAGVAWAASGQALRFAQVLVLATPCPLLIAVPVAFMAGTGRLAKLGIVVKSQDVLEQLSRVTDVFFDKTGTLTVKQPQVVRVDLANHQDSENQENQENSGLQNRILMFAGVLETYSQHILAGGIAKAGSDLWQNTHPSAVPQLPSVREYPVISGVKETAGQGICASVDGVNVRVGRKKYVLQASAGNPEDESQATEDKAKRANVENISKIESNFEELSADEMATYVSFDGKLVGRIVLKDVPRENAKSTIQKLKEFGVRSISMLTGDGLQAAQTIAKSVGIEHVKANLLPEDKLECVKQHYKNTDSVNADNKYSEGSTSLLSTDAFDFSGGKTQKCSITMMVGDGVNDAPVLAAANIGVALTDGTDTAASECAQVVIMNNNIYAVANAVSVAKHTKRVMVQAVMLGIGLAVISMIAAAFGLIPAVLGAMMQEMIDVVSILWALTALKGKRA
ncbi:heavy metal translocating P-type ATPase [Gardnerella vaginalis]|uniref:Heavy metal translocating P-type ATPase n=2 Tax=Gardnerella vaginalis TaxID=2702 RepID=E3D7T9_GARV3|nr:heavy metal translocating P-type ATPase [Gardnerella vaginalis]ADP38247.1 heavy metal translocating P-type ATPase [Gardnerella vaginalis ATCC 14019]PKZ54341.1 heavy metal translocating P-type ATPase [Gardnerella vaginalis]PKZ56453.1 heavy metal translocating P-type ATPase [Gardnerella vaginalis]RFD79298.1 ATPase P [Gardnerella vaginalis]TCH80833.1 heavy metal translocating P-type ATPase [Gardnerella vaginalis]